MCLHHKVCQAKPKSCIKSNNSLFQKNMKGRKFNVRSFAQFVFLSHPITKGFSRVPFPPVICTSDFR